MLPENLHILLKRIDYLITVVSNREPGNLDSASKAVGCMLLVYVNSGSRQACPA